MPAGGLTPEQMSLAIGWLYLLELAYWLAFIAVVRLLFAALARRDWFGIISSLSLALFVWPWSPIAARQLVWLLFDWPLPVPF
jgi:hypothetical protein